MELAQRHARHGDLNERPIDGLVFVNQLNDGIGDPDDNDRRGYGVVGQRLDRVRHRAPGRPIGQAVELVDNHQENSSLPQLVQ